MKDLVLVVFGVGGLLGFGFGLVQWLFTRRWKQWEFVAKQVFDMESNALFRAAMRMLDFRDATVVINGKKIRFDRERLAVSIISHKLAGWPEWTAEQVEVRLAFCEFLDGLQRLHNYVRAGLLRYKHLDPYVPYWIERLTYIPKPEDSAKEPHAEDFRGCLWTFLDEYGYGGVRELAKHYAGRDAEKKKKAEAKTATINEPPEPSRASDIATKTWEEHTSKRAAAALAADPTSEPAAPSS